jgi:hypothetical protein
MPLVELIPPRSVRAKNLNPHRVPCSHFQKLRCRDFRDASFFGLSCVCSCSIRRRFSYSNPVTRVRKQAPNSFNTIAIDSPLSSECGMRNFKTYATDWGANIVRFRTTCALPLQLRLECIEIPPHSFPASQSMFL